MKRLLAVLGIICLLTGCAPEGPYVPTGGNLYNGTDTPTPPQVESTAEVSLAYNKNGSFQPFTSTDTLNRTLLPMIYQGLFATDYQYQTTPILCKSYQVSADMRTWTFHLENATFSDGQALTAYDVVASLRAAKTGYYAGRFLHVKTIEAVSGAVVITTDTDMSNLPLLLDIPIVKDSQVEASFPLGTGPYMLEDTADGKQLRRQPAWWCSASFPVNAQTIPLKHGTTQGELWDLYKFSDMSMVSTESYIDFPGDYELWEAETGYFMYITCNMNSKVFSNESIRSALTYAIDRDSLVSKHFQELARSASLPCSPSFPYYSPSLADKYSYRPEKFAQAVADAQLTNNTIELLVNREDPVRLRVAQDIAETLTAGGLSVTVLNVAGQDYINALKWENYDLFLGQTKLSPNMDLTAFFTEGGSLNYGAITDVAAYAMCLKALENNGNYQSLHKLVMEDGRLCPILVRSNAVYGRRGVFTGLSPSRDNIFYYSLGKTMESAKITE